MISNKLLSSVLSELLEKVNTRRVKDWSVPIKHFDSIVIKDNKVYFHESKQNTFPYKPVEEHTINIYELAHKCKEWAVNLSPNKHALSSYPRWGDIRNYKKTNGFYYICQHLVSGAQFEAETEPEAIFKACEWLLNELSN